MNLLEVGEDQADSGWAAGFSLDEIALMFAPDGRPRIDRKMLAAKAEELDATIRKLTDVRDSPAARRGLPRAEPHGMSYFPPHHAGRCLGSFWSTKEKEPETTCSLRSVNAIRGGPSFGSRSSVPTSVVDFAFSDSLDPSSRCSGH